MEKKRTIWQAVVCVVLVCLIWGGYFVVKFLKIDRNLELKEDDFSWVYQVDSVDREDNEFVIRGFAFELERDSEKGAFEIVLQDIESKKMLYPKMEYIERTDVNDYFLCEYDYLQSGFEAMIKTKKIDLEKGHYEVLLRDAGERKTYQTGTYISKGELMYTNPLEFEPLDVEGTDLKETVEQGVLRVYRPDYKMYVYQYEGDLYWIAEEGYEFNEWGDVIVQYQLDTTQVDRLPQQRLDNNWFWDNLGFQFAGHELKDINTGGFRVARMHLPVEYSVEKIWTGNHNGKWIWIQYFRPFYFFD